MFADRNTRSSSKTVVSASEETSPTSVSTIVNPATTTMDGFLGRRGEYAKTGHGGNAALSELNDADLNHRQHLQFSILQVFSPNAHTRLIDNAEIHYKKALMSRGEEGLNRN